MSAPVRSVATGSPWFGDQHARPGIRAAASDTIGNLVGVMLVGERGSLITEAPPDMEPVGELEIARELGGIGCEEVSLRQLGVIREAVVPEPVPRPPRVRANVATASARWPVCWWP